MWSCRELQSVSSHRAVAAGRGQVPGRLQAAMGPPLLLQLRQSLLWGVPTLFPSHPSPKLPADLGLPGADLQLD